MKKSWLIIIILFIFILICSFFIQKDYEKTPETIYINGNIITLDSENSIASRMHVKDGKIFSIGKIKEYPKEIKVIDLKGATILPGFIDSHSHVALSSFLDAMIDLSGFTHKSNEEIWTYLAQQLKNKKEGEWIVCKGIDPILIEDLKIPNIHFLDSISPKNPILLISQSLHNYWGNTLAFNEVGINKNTKNPSKNSYYEKDTLGELTGAIIEQKAFLKFSDHLNKSFLNSKNLIKYTVSTFKKYAENGNTTIVSAGISISDKKPLRLYEHLSSEKTGFTNQLLSSLGFLPKRQALPRHLLYIRHDRLFMLPETKPLNTDFYGIIGIKHWYDGSPYTGSMYLKEPYLNSDLSISKLHIKEGHTGKPLIQKQELTKFINTYSKKGWQIAIHTQGDKAVEDVLNIYEKINEKDLFTKLRPRLEHCLLSSIESIEKMKRLNITPSFHINHLYYYGQKLNDDIIGSQRSNTMLPIRHADSLNLKFSLHADQPMFESNPFRLIQTAVERKTKEGDYLGKQYSINILSALKAMTINAAWQIHKEDKIGSLEKGKYADFIIVDKNPLTINTSDLSNIKILNTFVNGNEVLFPPVD